MAGAYSSQTNPGGSTPFSGANAEEFGAAIGRGLGDVGAVADHILERKLAANKDAQNAAAALEFAKVSNNLDTAEIDGRDQAGPGGTGHSETVAKLADTSIATALGNIKDPKLRAAYQARYEDLRGNVFNRAYGWERASHTAKMVNDAGETTDTLANGQLLNPDPVGLQVSLETAGTMWEHMDVSADVKEKGKRESQAAIAAGFANAMIDKDPHAFLGDSAKGTPGILDKIATYLDPKQVETLRSGAKIEIRRLDAEQRAAFDRAKAQASEDNTLFADKISKGYVPTDKEWADHTALAKQYGLDKQGFDIGVLHDQADVNREFRTATPMQLHQVINDLEAKKAEGKTSQAENIRLENVKAFAGPAIDRWNTDPEAAAAAAGDPRPQVDWNDPTPQQLEANNKWARSLASSAGLVNPPLLPNDVLKVYRQSAAQGAGGQLEVAAKMRAWFGSSAAAVVQQIDPNNQDMQLMVGLHPRIGQLYKEGVAAVQAGSVKLGASPEDEQAMRDVFAKYAPGIPASMQPAVYRAARNITAGIASEFSNSAPTGDVLTSAFDQAMQRAGGRTGAVSDFNAPGGFAEWNGRYAWLPPTVTSNQFIARISRAGPADWAKAAGGEPYYRGPDGKLTKLSESQVAHLKQYPLEIGTDAQGRQIPGVYRMVMPGGGYVGNKDGSPWQFDIRQLGTLNGQLAAHGYVRH
jgi:hypothetical protein